MIDLELLKYSGLKEAILKKIISTILHHKPVDKIILFGSRAQKVSKKTFHIDLANLLILFVSHRFNWIRQRCPKCMITYRKTGNTKRNQERNNEW